MFWKYCSRLKKKGSRPRCRTMLKKTWNTQKTPTNMFWGFSRISWKSGSRLKIRFSAQMSNNAKKNTLKHSENTNKTCFEAFWEILENPVLGWKIRFSAQISNYAKIPWNTQKTPPKHVLILNNLLAMVRCLGQPTLFIILQMICTDQNWGSC